MTEPLLHNPLPVAPPAEDLSADGAAWASLIEYFRRGTCADTAARLRWLYLPFPSRGNFHPDDRVRRYLIDLISSGMYVSTRFILYICAYHCACIDMLRIFLLFALLQELIGFGPASSLVSFSVWLILIMCVCSPSHNNSSYPPERTLNTYRTSRYGLL